MNRVPPADVREIVGKFHIQPWSTESGSVVVPQPCIATRRDGRKTFEQAVRHLRPERFDVEIQIDTAEFRLIITPACTELI